MTINRPPIETPMTDDAFMISPTWQRWVSWLYEQLRGVETAPAGNLLQANTQGRIQDAGRSIYGANAAISLFSGYDDAGEVDISASDWSEIELDTVVLSDEDFTHYSPSEEVIFNFNGKARVSYYATVYCSSHTNNTLCEMKIRKVLSDGTTEDIAGTLGQSLHRAADTRGQIAAGQTISVEDGDLVKLIAMVTSGSSTITTVAAACGMAIERLQ